MLSRELSDLLMARDGVDFAADAVGDDVFHWQLTFERFTPACPLAAVRLSSALYDRPSWYMLDGKVRGSIMCCACLGVRNSCTPHTLLPRWLVTRLQTQQSREIAIDGIAAALQSRP